jgi:cysteine-rich repeat protein
MPGFCGNGRIEAGEQCDDGMANSNLPNAHCRMDCSLQRCGDGIVDPPLETCDDGNTVSGDGCSKDCKIETGSTAQTNLPAQVIDLSPQNQQSSTESGATSSEVVKTITPPKNTGSGPAALAIIAVGAAAGFAAMRRRRTAQ